MVEKSEGEVGSEKGRGVETANDMSRVYLIIMSSTACPLWGKCILAVTLIVALVEHVHRYIDEILVAGAGAVAAQEVEEAPKVAIG